MALFNKKSQKNEFDGMTFQAHFNTYGQIEVCKIDRETGLALVLVARFQDTFDFNRWTRDNKISSGRIVWGTPNQNAETEFSRKYAL